MKEWSSLSVNTVMLPFLGNARSAVMQHIFVQVARRLTMSLIGMSEQICASESASSQKKGGDMGKQRGSKAEPPGSTLELPSKKK